MSSFPFFLRDSRANEMRARVKITPRQRVAFSRVGWFSGALTFRSLYYPWGKMGDYSWSSPKQFWFIPPGKIFLWYKLSKLVFNVARVNCLYSGHCKDLDLVSSIAISSPLQLEVISVWDSAAVRIRGLTVRARCLQGESSDPMGSTPDFKWRRWIEGFWGLKFPIPGFFGVRKFGKYFLGDLIWGGIFLGIQSNLKNPSSALVSQPQTQAIKKAGNSARENVLSRDFFGYGWKA